MPTAAPCLQALLVRRGVEPFAGYWSLPGGKLWGDEALDEAAWRQLAEKTALRASYLEQLYTFELCDASRQMDAAVVAYYALVRTDGTEIAPGRNTMEAAWFPVDALPSRARLRQRRDPALRAPAPAQQGGVRARRVPVPAASVHDGAAPRRLRGDPRAPHRPDQLPPARRGDRHDRAHRRARRRWPTPPAGALSLRGRPGEPRSRRCGPGRPLRSSPRPIPSTTATP